MNHTVGIVAIGRNEGARLEACLDSVIDCVGVVVYVDSGSSDGSVAMARERGAEVVELDPSMPFTAARARNAGVARLAEVAPALDFVQFVDGDCAVSDGWLEVAVAALQANEKLAVVCGRRREREPDASVYNLLCDIEWDRPTGEVDECGGDAMMRLSCLREVGGFDSALIAGEEPELCARFRARGWCVLRLAHEMTLHDAAMTSWLQWWLRAKRSGYAFGLVHAVTGGAIWGRQVRSILVYCVVLPALAASLAVVWTPWTLMLLALPLLSVYRIRLRELKHGRDRRAANAWAWSCILSKAPALVGLLSYRFDRIRGARRSLIEYKQQA